jgi:hypothetical protein
MVAAVVWIHTSDVTWANTLVIVLVQFVHVGLQMMEILLQFFHQFQYVDGIALRSPIERQLRLVQHFLEMVEDLVGALDVGFQMMNVP